MKQSRLVLVLLAAVTAAPGGTPASAKYDRVGDRRGGRCAGGGFRGDVVLISETRARAWRLWSRYGRRTRSERQGGHVQRRSHDAAVQAADAQGRQGQRRRSRAVEAWRCRSAGRGNGDRAGGKPGPPGGQRRTLGRHPGVAAPELPAAPDTIPSQPRRRGVAGVQRSAAAARATS